MAAIFITVDVVSLDYEDYGGFYEDSIGICPHTGNVHILCRGQRLGRSDNIIEENDTCHIFSRRRKTDNFTYWGVATKEWTTSRKVDIGLTCSVEDMSLFKFIIHRSQVIREIIPRIPGGPKMAALRHIGVDLTVRRNIMTCFQRL